MEHPSDHRQLTLVTSNGKLTLQQRPNAAMMSAKRSRETSEELGSGGFDIAYNEQTGRPIRKSAGRRSLESAMIDIDEAAADITDYDESDRETQDDDAISLLPPSKKRRLPSTPLRPDGFSPTLSYMPDFPMIRNEFGAILLDSPVEDNNDEASTHIPEALHLTINIPPGFEGPLKIDIPRTALTLPASNLVESSSESKSLFAPSHPISKACIDRDGSETWGWSTFPAEIRNRIYRLLFVQDRPFKFYAPLNFDCSSQFLRTCKQVHSEGREILYSENSFIFSRNTHLRGPYWEYIQMEIGFKDVRLFLTSIGNRSLSLLREVTFICEDTKPSGGMDLNNEERRFVNDPNLLECMRMIGRHGKLRKIQFCFQGRKRLQNTDDRFLVALKGIKADEAKVVPNPHMLEYAVSPAAFADCESKVASPLKTAIEKALTRKKKLHTM